MKNVMTSEKPKIWVVLPAFNEADSLPLLLPKIVETLERESHVFEVVVVDDGSNDETAQVLNEYKQQLPLHVVTHILNRGLGETERDGFEFVAMHGEQEDILVRMDCDDTHEPEYIPQILAKLSKGYDVVNTSRFQPGGGQRGVGAYRGFISLAANGFMRLIFRIPGVRDYSCGYRSYRVGLIQDALTVYGNSFIQLKGLGFTSTLEILVKLHLMGARFAEVPFTLRYDQKASRSKMVGSVTVVGYLIMAIFYHWPFGGWRNHYRDLACLYRRDRSKSLDKYQGHHFPHRA